MTDEELETVYEDSFKAAFMASPSSVTAFLAALRAVFRAGARAQRDAFVDELLEADATWSVKEAQVLADNAMQRVAPLVGGEG